MADLSIPNTMADGKTILAAQHNQNYDAIKNYINERNDGVSEWENVNAVDLQVSGTVTVPVESIDENDLASTVAGDGLSGGAGDPLAVKVDSTTIEIATDTLQVKSGGIGVTQIASAIAGDGLSGGGGSALSVNVDNSTIETNSDALRVKDLGITEGKLASAVVAKLGQNIGIVARAVASSTSHAPTLETALSYTGQGRLNGVSRVYTTGGDGPRLKITVDGIVLLDYTGTDANLHAAPNDGDQATVLKGVNTIGTLNELNIFFKTSLLVEHCSDQFGNTVTTRVQYERQA